MSETDRSVLCAIGHGLYAPWVDILHDGQERTWLADPWPIGLEVLHFHATPLGRIGQMLDRWHEQIRWNNPWMALVLRNIEQVLGFSFLKYVPNSNESKLLQSIGKAIHIKSPDARLTYRWKALGLFKYFIEETDFDYLFITSTASYVRMQLLKEYIQELPINNVYVGAYPYLDANFISGSNRILSRDVVEKVLKNAKIWRPGIIEDVELSNVLEKLGIGNTGYAIANIASLSELNHISDEFLLSNYHFRLKAGPLNNRGDVEIMLKLHARFKTLDGSK